MTVFGATDRRVVVAVALAAGAALALAGCGAGQISQTALQVPAVNGNQANVGSIALRNVHVLYPDSQEYTNKKGGKAALAFVAANNSASLPDQILKITTDNATVTITPQNRTEVPGGGVLVANTNKSDAPTDQLQSADDPEADPVLVELTDLKQDVSPGLTVPITFSFKRAGDVTVSVPVDAGDAARHSSDKSKSDSEAAPTHGGYTEAGNTPGGESTPEGGN
ncbi:hypothetical protein [Antrihabitans cavernicola]|uniref:hypothetical protein n=1 Tax=Antrihabitans cavernicola TaxID=2495913 RepID=UPI001F40E4A6|nr:hypothetical protein [Spelaeibacter cavernicola]